MDKRHAKQLRVAVFGGAFDPPHLGHRQFIKQVLSAEVVDQVWLMPNFESTWKKIVVKAKDRLRMCQILAAEFKGKVVRISSLEIEMAGQSYTLATVRELKRRYPKIKFYWLIGSELVATLPKWEKAEGLLKEIEFLVFPRGEISSSEIRERIKKGLSISKMVPQKIADYMKIHKLYQ